MYVSGTASATQLSTDAHLIGARRAPCPSAAWRRGARPAARPTSAPTLWRVRAYSSPGLPSPTTSRSAAVPRRRSTGYSSPESSAASASADASGRLRLFALYAFALFALFVLGGDARRRDLGDDEVGLDLGARRLRAAGCPRRAAGRRWRARATSISIDTGMLPGMASTVRWKSSCSSRPPSLTPVASPIEVDRDLGAHRDVAADADEVDVHQLAPRGVAVDLAGEREHARRRRRRGVISVLAPLSPARMCCSSRAGTVTDNVSVPRP